MVLGRTHAPGAEDLADAISSTNAAATHAKRIALFSPMLPSSLLSKDPTGSTLLLAVGLACTDPKCNLDFDADSHPRPPFLPTLKEFMFRIYVAPQVFQ